MIDIESTFSRLAKIRVKSAENQIALLSDMLHIVLGITFLYWGHSPDTENPILALYRPDIQ